MKLLIWLLIGVAIVIWVVRSRNAGTSEMGASTVKKNRDGELMVRCAHCGIYVPESEALTSPAGKVFCSDAHRLQHASH